MRKSSLPIESGLPNNASALMRAMEAASPSIFSLFSLTANSQSLTAEILLKTSPMPALINLSGASLMASKSITTANGAFTPKDPLPPLFSKILTGEATPS